MIFPVKNGNAKYPLKNDTFYITTESATGSSNQVVFSLNPKGGKWITNIGWRFSDWGYDIKHCTPGEYTLKFPVTPPTGIIYMTWEVKFTTEDITLKCNTLEVLHFFFNDTHNTNCTSEVKGKIANEVKFWKSDTATKIFISEQVGK